MPPRAWLVAALLVAIGAAPARAARSITVTQRRNLLAGEAWAPRLPPARSGPALPPGGGREPAPPVPAPCAPAHLSGAHLRGEGRTVLQRGRQCHTAFAPGARSYPPAPSWDGYHRGHPGSTWQATAPPA